MCGGQISSVATASGGGTDPLIAVVVSVLLMAPHHMTALACMLYIVRQKLTQIFSFGALSNSCMTHVQLACIIWTSAARMEALPPDTISNCRS